jgi:hypothetical protein
LSSRKSITKKIHHPKTNLAKFGYIISIKVFKKKTQNPFLFLATSGRSHHKTLAIWNFKNSKSGEFGPFCQQKKHWPDSCH